MPLAQHSCLACLVVILALGCGRDRSAGDESATVGRGSAQDSAPSPALPVRSVEIPEIPEIPSAGCFALDSLRRAPLFFANMSTSEETGDVGGLEIRFVLGPLGGMGALIREAEGGLPAPQRPDSLGYDAVSDSITIWWTVLGNQYTYRLKPACDYLTGVGTFWVSSANPAGSKVALVLPRTLTPMPDSP